MTIRQKCIELAKKIAKKRDNYTCQRCGVDRTIRQIHGAHIIPVSARGTIAANPDNIIALCARCHKTGSDAWHQAPLAQDWFHAKFPGRYEYLRSIHEVRPVKKHEWLEIYRSLRSQINN
jgi:5-methylcytosine-specific restriction endonuclease McrA